MFRFNHHHQGAHYMSFSKVTVAKTISLFLNSVAGIRGTPTRT